jgi:site-specific DNA recombinase
MYYGYARVSTTQQHDTSIEVQLEYLKKQAEILGEDFRPCSEKVSGKLFEERSVFIGLINNTKEGDIIGIYDDSRFGRETGSNLDYLEKLTLKGVRLHDAGRFIDYNSPIDKMIFTVGSAFATYQREIQLKKSKEGIARKKENGDWIVKNTFGYDLNYSKGKPVVTINETQAYYIRYIFDEFCKGRTCYDLAQELQDISFEGTTFRLKAYNVPRILLKPLYMGYYLKDTMLTAEKRKTNNRYIIPFYNRNELEKELVKSNYYPAIIEPEKWWYVFENYRDLTKPKIHLYKRRTTDFELTGIIRSECCGMGLIHNYSRSCKDKSVFVPYYSINKHYPTCTCHVNGSLREDLAECVFRASFFLTFLDPVNTGKFYDDKKALLNNSLDELNRQEEIVNEKIKEIDKGLNNLINLAVQGIDASLFRDKMNELNAEKDKLKKELANVKYAINSQEGDLEELLIDSSEEIIDRFIHSESEARRNTHSKYCGATFGNGNLTISYFNGKKFVFPWSSYVRNPEKVPLTFKMYFRDTFEASGSVLLETYTVTFDHIEESDEFKKYVNDENDKLAEKASELLLQAKENTCVIERVPNNNRV